MGRNIAVFGLLALLTAACDRAAAPGDPDPSAPGDPDPSAPCSLEPEAEPTCAREQPPSAPPASLSVLGDAGRGSPIVAASLGRPHPLSVDPHGRVLIVADEEGDAVRVLDATSGEVLSERPVSGGPTQALVASGDRVVVALRRESAVVMLSMSEDLSLQEVGRAPTAEEPVALALAADPPRILVASGFGHRLEGFSPEGLSKGFSIDLPREPRGITVSGGHAYVAHMVGSTVSDVDLGTSPPQRSQVSLAGTDISLSCGCLDDFSFFLPRFAGQGFALAVSEGRAWMPFAFSRPGTSESSSGYGAGGAFAPVDAGLVSIDLATKKLAYRVEDTTFTSKKLRERYEVFGATPAVTPAGRCLLPRAVTVVPSSKHLLVACLGSDEVVEIDTADTAFARSFMRSFRVPSGPAGLALDEARGEAFVWSAFERAVSVLPIEAAKPATDTAGQGSAKTPAPTVLAAQKTQSVSKAKPSTTAMVPDRAFDLPALAGEDPREALGRRLFHSTFDKRVSRDGRACASCHPDGRDDGLVWGSPKGPLQTPMLAGRLEETAPYGWVGDAATVGDHLHDTFSRLGGKGLGGAELEALVLYVTRLPGPARPAGADARVARGKEIFESVDTMCTICHTQGGKGTDGARHDVGSGLALETPTLRFVAGTAPYFHDGRYATLRDLLKGSSGKMGGSLDRLGDADMDALEAYLLTL